MARSFLLHLPRSWHARLNSKSSGKEEQKTMVGWRICARVTGSLLVTLVITFLCSCVFAVDFKTKYFTCKFWIQFAVPMSCMLLHRCIFQNLLMCQVWVSRCFKQGYLERLLDGLLLVHGESTPVIPGSDLHIQQVCFRDSANFCYVFAIRAGPCWSMLPRIFLAGDSSLDNKTWLFNQACTLACLDVLSPSFKSMQSALQIIRHWNQICFEMFTFQDALMQKELHFSAVLFAGSSGRLLAATLFTCSSRERLPDPAWSTEELLCATMRIDANGNNVQLQQLHLQPLWDWYIFAVFWCIL